MLSVLLLQILSFHCCSTAKNVYTLERKDHYGITFDSLFANVTLESPVINDDI